MSRVYDEAGESEEWLWEAGNLAECRRQHDGQYTEAERNLSGRSDKRINRGLGGDWSIQAGTR